MRKYLAITILLVTAVSGVSANGGHNRYNGQFGYRQEEEERVSRTSSYGFATVLGFLAGAGNQVIKDPNSSNWDIITSGTKGVIAGNAGMLLHRETENPRIFPVVVKAPVCVGGGSALAWWMLNR